MGMVFGIIQLLRFVDLTSPRTILLLRGGYLASQMLLLLLWTYIRSLALKAGGKEKKKGASVETVEVEEAASPFSGQPARKTKMTVAEYDVLEARKQMQQVVVGTLILMALHFWFGMVQALVLQIILPWKTLLTQPLVQIYLFGFAAEGPLKRPFKQPNPLADLMAAPAADETATETSSGTPRITEIREGKEEEQAEDAAIGTKDAATAKNRKKTGRKED